MAENVFTDSEGNIIRTSQMSDEHQIIKITEKQPVLQNIGKIVAGDTNSNILTFEMKRFYDGVDLYKKDIRFICSNTNGIFSETAVNQQYNDEYIRFSWILSFAVTQHSEDVKAAIEFFGTEDGRNYSLKTMPFTIHVENSLDMTDIEVAPPTNWFLYFETRLLELEKNTDVSNLVDEVLENMTYEDEPIDFSVADTNTEGGE